MSGESNCRESNFPASRPSTFRPIPLPIDASGTRRSTSTHRQYAPFELVLLSLAAFLFVFRR